MGDEPAIKILLLEDERAPAEAVADSLEQRGFEVVGIVGTVKEVVDTCGRDRPDVIVADIDLAHYSTVQLDVGGRLALNLPALLPDGPPVLWWSGHGGRHRVPAAVAGGAGFVDKREGLDDLAGAIRRVADGKEVWRVEDLRAARVAPKRPTEGQLAVLRVIALGATNKEVAAHLEISERTVESHLSNLYDRYPPDNRLELVDFARANDWII